jgi:hypothetical protein
LSTISSYSIITKNKINLNGKPIFSNINFKNEFDNYLKEIYQNLKIDYPKFYKMDNFSKLSFLNSEILLQNKKILKQYKAEEIGVIILTISSTLSTDLEYFETMRDENNYFPSPSIFTYTLPNICIAEICIRNNIKGENACFNFKKIDFSFICNYVNDLLKYKKIKACILGWGDYYSNKSKNLLGKYAKTNLSFMLFIENIKNGKLKFTKSNIEKILKGELNGKLN